MFGKKDNKKRMEKTELDKQIEDLIEQLKDCKDEDKKKELIMNIKDLTSVKVSLEGPVQKLNPNTIITCGFSLGTVIAIILYESRHAFSTKSIPFIPKIKF